MMAKLYVRIDDRLLHSEVLYRCIPTWQPQHVIVSSRLPWLDLVDPSVMPTGIKLTQADPAVMSGLVAPDEVTLVVFGTLLDLQVALDSGFRAESVTLANRARRESTRQLTGRFFLDEDEWAVLRELVRSGVAVVAESHPSTDGMVIDAALLAAIEAAQELG